MRNNLFITCLLLVLPILVSANHIEGKFISSDHHVRVKVKDYKRGIKIKGLVSHRYVKFKQIRANTFADYYGNLVKIVGPHKMVFRSRNWTDKISLYRLGYEPQLKYKRKYRNRGYQGGDFDNNRRRNNGNYANNDRYSDGHNDGYNDLEFNRLSQLEGTWKSNNPSKEVAILETRSGIKVKFRGDKKWTKFDSISEDNRRLIDKKENQYEVISSNKMIWTNRKGNKIVTINKISDEVRY